MQMFKQGDFKAKYVMAYVWTQENTSLYSLYFKPMERPYVLLKTVLGIFKRSFKRSACFYVTITILNDFNFLNSKQVFWKTKTFLKNLEYLFLVQITTNEGKRYIYIKNHPAKSQRKSKLNGKCKVNLSQWMDFYH